MAPRILSERLGLFWFIPDGRNSSRFATFSRAFSDAPKLGDLLTLEQTHAAAWPLLQRIDPTLDGYAFDHFPHGRVDFFKPGRRWLLFIGPSPQQKKFVAHVVQQWGISVGHLTVETDWSYKGNVVVGPPI